MLKLILIIGSTSLCALLAAQAGLSIDRSFPPVSESIEIRNVNDFVSDHLTDTMISVLKMPVLRTHARLPEPFFCHIESQIQKKSGLALRFRLGSLDYVNWLEGKYVPLTDLTRE